MDENNKTTTAEETKDKAADAPTEEALNNGSDDSTSSEKGEESSHNDSDIDFDAELEKERKGKPDPVKAKKAFDKRSKKRQEQGKDDAADDEAEEVDEEDLDDEDKPMTKREAREFLEKNQARTEALTTARTLSGSDKEAALIVAKWENRKFPSHLSVSEQIEECFAIVHGKKMIGERNEALRALKGKDSVNKNATAQAHLDTPVVGEPKLTPQDRQIYTQSGFVWNGQTQRYEKKLSNGNILEKNWKTGAVRMIKKSR